LTICSTAYAQGTPVLPYMSNWIRTLFDDETQAAAQTTLGLGTGDSPTWAGATVTNCAVLGSNSAVFQPNADSTTFFQVKDAAGTGYAGNFDTTNIRFGVGTNAPSNSVHVYNDDALTIGAQGVLVEQDGAGDATLRYLITGGYSWRMGIDNTDDFFKIVSNYIISDDLAYDVFRIDNLGNVGINKVGWTGGGVLTQKSKVDSDTVFDIFEATLDRGSASGGVGLGLGYLFRLENGAGSTHDAGRFRYEWTNPTSTAESSKFVISNYVAGSSVDSIIVDGTGYIGLNESVPETLLELTHASPYITLHNSTHEDTDGGRESIIYGKGEQGVDPFEEGTLGSITISHDGTGEDYKGKIVLSTNANGGANTLVDALTIDSAQNTKIGDGGTTNYTNIGADGTLTLAGTARKWQSQDLKPGYIKHPAASPPDSVEYQNRTFDAYDDTTEEQVFYVWHLPNNYATGTASVRGHFGGMVSNEAGAEYVAMGFEYWHFQVGETYDTSGAADGGGSVNITIANAEGNYVWHDSATGVVDTTGWTNGITAFRFFRDVDDTYTGGNPPYADDYTGDVLIGVYHLEYLRDSLGSS